MTDQRSLTTKQISLLFAVFLVFLLLPRLGLILDGVAYAEDWNHPHPAHLDSYRPFSAFILWLSNQVFGNDQLITVLPRLLSTLSYAAAFTVLTISFTKIGVKISMLISIFIFLCVHPALNEMILWGVTYTYALSFFISCIGIHLVFNAISNRSGVIGLFLLCVAALGYQMLATIAACALLVETLAKGLPSLFRLPRAALIIRLSAATLPIIVSLVALLIMQKGLGYYDFASRGVANSSTSFAEFLESRYYVLTNAFANYYQAQLDYVAGYDVTVGALKSVLFLITLIVLSLSLHRKSAYGVLQVTILYMLFFISLAPLLGTSAIPSGYRISLFSLILFATGFASIISYYCVSNMFNFTAIALISICSAVSLLVSLEDIELRAQIWKRDLANRAVVGRSQQMQTPVEVCKPQEDDAGLNTGILVSYNRTGAKNYSVWHTASYFLESFLEKGGINPDHVSFVDIEVCQQTCSTNSALSNSRNQHSQNRNLVCL